MISFKSTKEKGDNFENIAAEHLKSHGLSLIQQNFQCKFGEIDLVMREKNTVIFVEVRYRNTTNFGGAAASVDRKKQSKLIKTAQYFIQQWKEDTMFRFDVVAISAEQSTHKIQWIKNAFDEF